MFARRNRLQINTARTGTAQAASRSLGMENSAFQKLSPMEICRRMSAICQKSADETRPGIHQRRLQKASDRFRDEAGILFNCAAEDAGEPLGAGKTQTNTDKAGQ